MSQNSFAGRALSPVGPIERVRPVTPDDVADLPEGPARGLFVGAAGRVTFHDAQGGVASLVSLASQYHPIRVSRVLAAGTDAGDILALY